MLMLMSIAFAVCVKQSNCYIFIMDITEIRRNKLNALLAGYDNKERFAEALQIKPNYLYQLRTGKRPITEKTARKFETKLKLKHLWFDSSSYDNDPENPGNVSDAGLKPRYIYTKQELDLIEYFNLLTFEQKDNYLAEIIEVVKKNRENFDKLKSIYGK